MPRPQKGRKVCMLPCCKHFSPEQIYSNKVITMKIDEYECIRLIDFEGCTQAQCAQKMEIARTTVQAIYASARQKIAACLVLGQRLQLTGGEYRLCQQHGCCGNQACPKTQFEKTEKK